MALNETPCLNLSYSVFTLNERAGGRRIEREGGKVGKKESTFGALTDQDELIQRDTCGYSRKNMGIKIKMAGTVCVCVCVSITE